MQSYYTVDIPNLILTDHLSIQVGNYSLQLQLRH